MGARSGGGGGGDPKGISGMDAGEIEHTGEGGDVVLKIGELAEAGKPDKGSTQDSNLDSIDSLKWLRVSSNEKQNKKVMEI